MVSATHTMVKGQNPLHRAVFRPPYLCWVRAHRCIHMHTRKQVHTHMYMHTRTHTRVHRNTRINTHTYVHMYMHTHACSQMHTCIHAHRCIHTCAHVQTCTLARSSPAHPLKLKSTFSLPVSPCALVIIIACSSPFTCLREADRPENTALAYTL